MNYIKGRVRSFLYENESGYKVGLFRVKETNDEEMDDFLNKTITFTGYFGDLNTEDTYILYGKYIYHDRYGHQYKADSYERVEPVGKDAVIAFLSSNLIQGCGEKTAMKIVEVLGEDALNKIKQDESALLLVPGISSEKASKIYHSILKYSNTEDMIFALKEKGFSLKEALDIIKVYGDDSLKQVEENIYAFQSFIEFDKLDRIFLSFGDVNDKVRVLATILESMQRLSFAQGDTYFYAEEIYDFLRHTFHIYCDEEVFYQYLEELVESCKITKEEKRYYLADVYKMEVDIADALYGIATLPDIHFSDIDDLLKTLQGELGVTYNEEQKNAVKTALQNRVTVITGGPGTGKTTIINAIVKLFVAKNHLNGMEIMDQIALLAPTGRASKKMSESTQLPAMTIHRFLKWQKDSNSFAVNATNKERKKLVIVDEMSMIDTFLFDALLKGLKQDMQLILVGDTNQLPSVGAGEVLHAIITSDMFAHVPLHQIYRQSNNSYIPYLAKEIREHALSESFLDKKDDYNFLEAPSVSLKDTVRRICEKCMEKGLSVDDVQVLAPKYKGENGIDVFNAMLQDLFNPRDGHKKETKYGDFIYRVGDKVLQLVNDPDNNVFNGDIGHISSINMVMNGNKKKEVVTINFDGILVGYSREDLANIRHAYAITVHKSQGSEFPHVILPICKSYYKMLYNRLIYTGVSRAKKSLVIVGEASAFQMAVQNDYSQNRKTSLKDKILYKFDSSGTN